MLLRWGFHSLDFWRHQIGYKNTLYTSSEKCCLTDAVSNILLAEPKYQWWFCLSKSVSHQLIQIGVKCIKILTCDEIKFFSSWLRLMAQIYVLCNSYCKAEKVTRSRLSLFQWLNVSRTQVQRTAFHLCTTFWSYC